MWPNPKRRKSKQNHAPYRKSKRNLAHQNILSTVALFVCTSLMGMAVFV